MRRHHNFSAVVRISVVLSFLVAITGILDLTVTSAQKTQPGATSHTITSSYTGAAEVVSLPHVRSGDTVVTADQGPGDQPVPSRTEHCPTDPALSVACPDVLSPAVLDVSVPGFPARTFTADAAAQPVGALPEVPAAALRPVSLILLSISRV